MTLAEIDARIPKYKHRGLLVDANLLLLYLIGELDPRLIARFKRTQAFKVEDFTLLKAITDFFSVVVTMPSVLTEVSNLAGQLTGKTRLRFFETFAGKVQLLQEMHLPSNEVVRAKTFPRLGLTDSAIILACKDRYLALTVDFALARFMEDNHLDVINFNYIQNMDRN